MAGKPKRKTDLVVLGTKVHVVEEMLSEGRTQAEVYRALGVSKMSWYDWLGTQEGRDVLARARTRATDKFAEESLQIADTTAPEDVQVAKLRIDTRKWLASKWNAGTYGENRGPLVNISLAGLHGNSLRKISAEVIEAIDESGE